MKKISEYFVTLALKLKIAHSKTKQIKFRILLSLTHSYFLFCVQPEYLATLVLLLIAYFKTLRILK